MSDTPPLRSSRPRILVVDDDAAMCALLETSLASAYEVVSRTRPEEAVGLIAREDFAVVLTDFRMRGMQGSDLCQRSLDLRPDLPVVVMTAFGSIDSAVQALRAGAYDYVTKPIPAATLRYTLDRAIEARRLRGEVKRLGAARAEGVAAQRLVGASRAMSNVRDLISRVAPSEASILITGESGTGKEVAARAIHDASSRAARPFVAINCAAMPESLLESELFGHVKGAFTDAKGAKEGLFVRAHGGTLLFDEIGDMPIGLQPKLLRVLQERCVRPIGAASEVAVDVRVLSATHRDLEAAIAERTFREDLYYRLNVVEVALPPLRARGDDVLVLAAHFLDAFASRSKKPPKRLSAGVAEHLLGYPWPGNVRELANAMERAVALAQLEEVVPADLPARVRARSMPPPAPIDDLERELVPLEEVERRYVLRAFEVLDRNRSLTAQTLGIDRKTLARKLEKWGISSE